jgi:hypothetical protein
LNGSPSRPRRLCPHSRRLGERGDSKDHRVAMLGDDEGASSPRSGWPGKLP